MLYRVMAVTDEEYRKADTLPRYSPKEYEVAVIEADSERAAQLDLRRGIRNGTYPRGSQIVTKCEL